MAFDWKTRNFRKKISWQNIKESPVLYESPAEARPQRTFDWERGFEPPLFWRSEGIGSPLISQKEPRAQKIHKLINAVLNQRKSSAY